MFIWDEGRGHKLTEATYFCLRATTVDSHVVLVHEGLDGMSGGEKDGTSSIKAKRNISSSKSVPTKSDTKNEMRVSQCAVYSLGDDDDDGDVENAKDVDGDSGVTVEDDSHSREATCVSIAPILVFWSDQDKNSTNVLSRGREGNCVW